MFLFLFFHLTKSKEKKKNYREAVEILWKVRFYEKKKTNAIFKNGERKRSKFDLMKRRGMLLFFFIKEERSLTWWKEEKNAGRVERCPRSIWWQEENAYREVHGFGKLFYYFLDVFSNFIFAFRI